MKKKNIIAAMACAAVLAVTACTSQKEVMSVADAQATEVMTIAESKVNMDDYNLYLLQYIYNTGTTRDMVTADMETSIKSSVIAQMKLEYVEYELAKTMGLELSEEEKANAASGEENFYNYFGQEFLESYGIDKECVSEMFDRQVYIQALINKSTEDLVSDNVALFEEQYKDMNCHTVYYALFPSVQYENNAVKTDENGAPLTLSDEEIAANKANAEELASRAQNGESMEDLVVEYEVVNYSGLEHNFDGMYTPELNELIESLEDGEISDVVETDAGFMIVRMDKKVDDEYKSFLIEYIASKNAEDMIPKLQENWLGQSGVDQLDINMDTLGKINIADMCDAVAAKVEENNKTQAQ